MHRSHLLNFNIIIDHCSRAGIIFLLLLSLSYCGTSASIRCLRTPMSGKVDAESVDTCQRALSSEPARLDLFQRTMALLMARGDYPQMIALSQNILAEQPRRADVLFTLAFSLRLANRCIEAISKYQQYLELNSADPDPYFGLGLCYEAQGENEKATRAFQTYLDRENRPARQSWIVKAESRLNALHGSKKPVLGQAPDSAPAQAPAPMPETNISSASAPPPAADPCAPQLKIIEADPFATAAYDKFAECAANQGKDEEIIRRMRMALRDNPDFSRGWLHLAKALRRRGDNEAARSAFFKACSLGIPEGCTP